jgi:general secretion pathway protein J
MRRARGFTLVELLVALFALAIMAGLSWRGLDGMIRARQMTEARADEVLTLQTGLAQWAADLEAIEQYPPSPALQWNGRVLRLTRRSSLSPVEGVHVVGWTRRDGQWVRWQSPAVTTRGELDTAWVQADLWSQNPSDAMRGQEVAITPLQDWQIFFYRCDAWTNPLSSDASQCASANPATGPLPAASLPNPGAAAAVATAGVLPDGVRLVLQLPPGRALVGRLQRDWVRPTVGGTKP